MLSQADVDIKLKKEDKPGHRKSGRSIISKSFVMLLVACFFSAWFIYRGYRAGISAFRSIQSSEDYSADVEENIHTIPTSGETQRVLHIDFVSSHSPKDQEKVLSSLEYSNFCDDVEFDVDWYNHLSGAGSPIKKSPTMIHENISVSGIVPLEEYHYYQICLASHPTHYHRIEVNLACNVEEEVGKHVAVPSLFYNADLYLSVDNPHPTLEHSTWISADVGNDKIAISTYLEDFVRAPSTPSGRGKVLFLGVFGRDARVHGVRDVTTPGIPYTLTVVVTNTKPRAGRLRGT